MFRLAICMDNDHFVKYEEDLLNMDAVQSGDLDTRKFDFFYPGVTICPTFGKLQF